MFIAFQLQQLTCTHALLLLYTFMACFINILMLLLLLLVAAAAAAAAADSCCCILVLGAVPASFCCLLHADSGC
jgi:hypothetical protein